MNTFNFELRDGKQLAIPAEYYPMRVNIVAIKKKLFYFTSITRFEAFFNKIGRYIFSPIFAVRSVINLSL